MIIVGGPGNDRKIRALLEAASEQEGGGPGIVTCESALREQGIDEASVAKKLKDLLSAKTRRWNPGKQEFEVFDDYDAQLAAVREIVKILGGYPQEREEDKDGEVQIISMTDRKPRSDR